MQFMLLIYPGSSYEAMEALSDEEKEKVAAAWDEVASAPGVTTGGRLALPTQAQTVRTRKGQALITDGPFAETKDAVGGYLLYEAGSIDDAVWFAQTIPSTWLGGAVEVRAIEP